MFGKQPANWRAAVSLACLVTLAGICAPCWAQRLVVLGSMPVQAEREARIIRQAVDSNGTCYSIDSTLGTVQVISFEPNETRSLQGQEWKGVFSLSPASQGLVARLRRGEIEPGEYGQRIDILNFNHPAAAGSTPAERDRVEIPAGIQAEQVALSPTGKLFIVGADADNRNFLHIVDMATGRLVREDLLADPGIPSNFLPLVSQVGVQIAVSPVSGNVVVVTAVPYQISIYSPDGTLLRQATRPNGATQYNLLKHGAGLVFATTTGPYALAVLADGRIVVQYREVQDDGPSSIRISEVHLEVFRPDLGLQETVTGDLPGKLVGGDARGFVYLMDWGNPEKWAFLKARLDDGPVAKR